MNRRVAICLLSTALASITAATAPARATPAADGCGSIWDTTACSSNGEVHVGQAAGSSSEQTPHTGRAPSRAPRDGDVRSVSCAGGDPGGALVAAGDVAGGNDAQSCGQQTAECAAETVAQDLAREQSATVLVVRDGGRWRYDGNGCVADGPVRVTVAMVRAQAQRLVPAAGVGLAPRVASLVNIESVMWVAAPARQVLAPVTLVGHRVMITLDLAGVAWSFGDGQALGDGPAGKAYDAAGDPCRARVCADYFGHVYRRAGKVTVAARASWHASFTVDGGDAVTIPGVVTGPRAQAPLVIRQARDVLVRNPDDSH